MVSKLRMVYRFKSTHTLNPGINSVLWLCITFHSLDLILIQMIPDTRAQPFQKCTLIIRHRYCRRQRQCRFYGYNSFPNEAPATRNVPLSNHYKMHILPSTVYCNFFKFVLTLKIKTYKLHRIVLPFSCSHASFFNVTHLQIDILI